MDLHSIVVYQMRVVDALKDSKLVRNVPHRSMIPRLQGYLFHGHQLASLVVYRNVDFSEPSLS